MTLYEDFDLFSDSYIFTVRISKAEMRTMRRHYREEVEERIASAIKVYANVNGRPSKSNWMWNRKKKRCCR